MDWEVITVYIILIAAVVLFITDRVRTDIVGLLIISILGLTGILKPKELLIGFSNQALVTIAAMFVLSAALMRSGLVAALGGKLTELSKGSPIRFLTLSLFAVCFMSAFINNTPVVVVFIPAVLTVCKQLGQSPSKYLMPISFASMLGGSATLIGTSSNILVSSLAEEAGYGAIGMFEFTVLGGVIVVVGMIYLILFSHRLLPARTTIASTLTADEVKEYITQVRISPESSMAGQKLAETPLADVGVRVAELIRGERIQRMEKESVLEVGDILLIRGDLNKILELERKHEISISTDEKEGDAEVKRVEMTIFELMVAPDSRLIGRTAKDIKFRDEFDVSVFALQRRGRHHQRDITDLDLRMGDILLVRGTMDALAGLRERDEFILLEGAHDRVIEKHKAPVALGTILAIVGLAAFGVFPISVLAIAGAALLVLFKILTPRDAYRSIDWPVLILIAGMIALGNAMGKTGALDLVADGLIGTVGQLGPRPTLWIFYFMTAALSLLILNKPAAVLCTPLGILLATQLGVDGKPFIMAVAFAASTAMATPMGYQTNLLVYGPGGYTYKDFVKFGLPLNILVGVIACLIIPWLWPF
ncbi:MAG: SLC13 family permease [Akkermansiaceae bacterium]|jgi:di/tricarboxylate transporter|tara:strand:+ start:8008 stop:9780 length:1773 start_codon:yes stop_codon:yes gene_type:complete